MSVKLSILFALLFSTAATAQDKHINEVKEFGANPGGLRMFLHIPTGGKLAKSKLLVVLHGCGQSANEISRLTGWNDIADSANIIVVYAEQRYINNMDRCFNWFNEKDIDKGKGESESISQMIRYCEERYPVDSSKIFITGFSAGAAMAVVMLATHPDLFRAGAIFAGGAYKIATDPFAAMKIMSGNIKLSKQELADRVKAQNPAFNGPYPRLIIFQGLQDPLVDPKNADVLVTQWAGLNNADTISSGIMYNYKGNRDINRFDHKDQRGKSFATVYSIDHLGHKIAVSDVRKTSKSLLTKNKKFDAVMESALELGILD